MLPVTQINNQDGRFYQSPKTRAKYPSVSTILKAMEDTTYLEKWKEKLALATFSEKEKTLPEKEKKKIIKERGEKESLKIRDACADRGTKIHAQIEENVLNPNNKVKLEKKQLNEFTNDYLVPVYLDGKPLVEKSVIWEKENIGYGGTFDFYGEIKRHLKTYKNETTLNVGKVLIDWKNPLNVKYPEAFSKEKGKYFPLTRYFLQTAAYVGAFNQMVEDKNLKVNQTMVVLNPQKSKHTVYFYYCDSYSTSFYWEKFKDLLHCYFSNQEFDWKRLDREIENKQFIPTRLIF